MRPALPPSPGQLPVSDVLADEAVVVGVLRLGRESAVGWQRHPLVGAELLKARQQRQQRLILAAEQVPVRGAPGLGEGVELVVPAHT